MVEHKAVALKRPDIDKIEALNNATLQVLTAMHPTGEHALVVGVVNMIAWIRHLEGRLRTTNKGAVTCGSTAKDGTGDRCDG